MQRNEYFMHFSTNDLPVICHDTPQFTRISNPSCKRGPYCTWNMHKSSCSATSHPTVASIICLLYERRHNSRLLLSYSITWGCACINAEASMPFASMLGGSKGRLWHFTRYCNQFPSILDINAMLADVGDLVQPASAALCAAGAGYGRLSRGGLKLHSNARRLLAEVV